MQQHSAQHLVSGVAERTIGAPTVRCDTDGLSVYVERSNDVQLFSLVNLLLVGSWELGSDTVCVDLDVKQELRNADGLIDGDIVSK